MQTTDIGTAVPAGVRMTDSEWYLCNAVQHASVFHAKGGLR